MNHNLLAQAEDKFKSVDDLLDQPSTPEEPSTPTPPPRQPINEDRFKENLDELNKPSQFSEDSKAADPFAEIDQMIDTREQTQQDDSLEKYQDMSYGDALQLAKKNFAGSWVRAVKDVSALAEKDSWKAIWQLGKEILSITGTSAVPYQPQAAQYLMDRDNTPILNSVIRLYMENYGSHAGLKRFIAEDPVGFLSDAAILVPFIGMIGKAKLPIQVTGKLKGLKYATNPAVQKGVEWGERAMQGTRTSGFKRGLRWTGRGLELIADPSSAIPAGVVDVSTWAGSKIPLFGIANRFRVDENQIIQQHNQFIDDIAGKYRKKSSPARAGEILTQSFHEYSRKSMGDIRKVIQDMQKKHKVKFKGEFTATHDITSALAGKWTSGVKNKVLDDFINTTTAFTRGERSLNNMINAYHNMVLYMNKAPSQLRSYIDYDSFGNSLLYDIEHTLREGITERYSKEIKKKLDNMLMSLTPQGPASLDIYTINSTIQDMPSLVKHMGGIDVSADEVRSALDINGIPYGGNVVTGDTAEIIGAIMGYKSGQNLRDQLVGLRDFHSNMLLRVFERNADTPEEVVPMIVREKSIRDTDIDNLKMLTNMSAENKAIFQAEVLREIFEESPTKWSPDGLSKTIDKIGEDKIAMLLEPRVFDRLKEISEGAKQFKQVTDYNQWLDRLGFGVSAFSVGGAALSRNWDWLLGGLIGLASIGLIKSAQKRGRYVLRKPTGWKSGRNIARGIGKTNYVIQRAERHNRQYPIDGSTNRLQRVQ